MKNLIRFELFVFLLLLLVSCRAEVAEKDVVARVNGEAVTLKELQHEVSLRARQYPSVKITPAVMRAQLDSMIERKLLVQEATKMGLAEKEDFVQTMRRYWEHTLIRELIDERSSETGKYAVATEEELERYYGNLGYRVTFKAIRAPDAKSAEGIRRAFTVEGTMPGEEIIGPLGYGDIASGGLKDVFEMDVGATLVFEEGGAHIVAGVVSKEPVPVKPYEELREEIKARIMEQKREQAHEEWLRDLRSRSSIEINLEALGGAGRSGGRE